MADSDRPAPRDGLQRDIGRLEGRVDALEGELREIKGDVKAILALVNQAKGGWKTLVIVGAVAGAAGALVTKLSIFAGVLPR